MSVVVVIGCCCVPQVSAGVLGQDPEATEDAGTKDPVASALERARLQYESNMDRVRSQALNMIRAEARDASRTGRVSADRLEKARLAEEAFSKRGAWPDLPGVVELRNRAAEAADKMRDGYARALQGYERTGRDDLGTIVWQELSAFEEYSDVVPWSEDVWPAAQPRELSDGSSATIPIDTLNEYRIEVQARALGDDAVLDVSLPRSEGQAVAFSAVPSRGSRVVAIVTVRDGFVGFDAGVVRQPEGAAATESPHGSSVVLTAREGSIEIKSVRIKPVVPGKPEQFQEVDAYPLWQPNSRWINRAPGVANNIWTVTERSSDRLTIMRPSNWTGQGEVYLDLLIGRNGQLTLTRVHRKNTRTPVADSNWQGQGVIRADSLTLRFEVESRTPGRNGEVWRETLLLTPEK